MRLDEISSDDHFKGIMNKIQAGVGAGPSQMLQDCQVMVDDLYEKLKEFDKVAGHDQAKIDHFRYLLSQVNKTLEMYGVEAP